MKKLLCILFSFLLLVGCTNQNAKIDTTQQYIKGVWMSFSEIDGMLQGDFKYGFNQAVKNCKSRKITDVFVHVRPYCDSYYPSRLFPMRTTATAQNFDILEYMIKSCHQNGIRFHAWINPYRVKTADSDVSTLPDTSIVKQWVCDSDVNNDANISTVGGVYLNPAASEVRALIINGIREIIDGYKVDGIHFDDYFYPTSDPAFDYDSYIAYSEKNKKPLPLEDWRRASVNALISGVYTAIKFKDKNIIFSISPSASIEENYHKQYADITTWCDSGCVDYIIPQLYFGFEYPDEKYQFNILLENWKKSVNGTNTKLLIGLATYKIGTQNEPDRAEWSNGAEVIKRQEDICKQTQGISGHVFFSYSSMCASL